MIEQLATQIQTLTELSTAYLILGVVIFIMSVVISVVLVNKMKDGIPSFISVIIGGVIFVVFLGLSLPLQDQISTLEEQRDNLIRQVYISLPCNELRLNILDQMQNNNQTWIDFQKDYYNLNCETPLRQEVLKLQESMP